ncbi:sensor histidine kinase [Paenibacillus hamazuiensis]|uniref:sensor histidine kinase n=1 Tax=Paenibacillus hamazuiensis TaxID=2936508 RepID=UPI002010BDFC|nr:HAMP domain-containing sensor histidine kinase [Paenibacillus hamazuiensis]
MIRSLYLRVALTFLLAVILGLTVAFFTTNYMFGDRFETMMQNNLDKAAQDISSTLVSMTMKEADSYLRSRRWLEGYYITLYDMSGNKTGYGSRPNQGEINNEAVRQVLGGQIVRDFSRGPIKQFVGYPLSLKEGSYAIFVQLNKPKLPDSFTQILLSVLTVTLIIGSLFVLVAARYLVLPLRLMTLAARRISGGNFDVKLRWLKRKDEIGELARSFSHMAGELKQLEQMRQDFVSGVSHEIQSPLTSIAGFSKLIRYHDLQGEERDQYLQIIQTEAERMSRMSENLLKLASLDSEHHPFHAEPYRLDEQIRKIILAQEPEWSGKELELFLTLPPAIIKADEDQMSQVWINLLHNAIKFTPPGGAIHISLELLLDSVQIGISDTGIGIAEDELPRIFDRFYKSDQSRQRGAGGNGLGLAIVRKIVDLHGGTITVKSDLGQGTVFRVTLPSGL